MMSHHETGAARGTARHRCRPLIVQSHTTPPASPPCHLSTTTWRDQGRDMDSGDEGSLATTAGTGETGVWHSTRN